MFPVWLACRLFRRRASGSEILASATRAPRRPAPAATASESFRHDPRLRERRLRLLVRHLQEQQVGELLQVVAVRNPVVAEDVAGAPQPLDEAVLGAYARSRCTESTIASACPRETANSSGRMSLAPYSD